MVIQVGAGIVLSLAILMTLGLGGARLTQPGDDAMDLGVRGTALTPCPDSPNCVSSFSDPDDRQHAVDPIPWDGEATTAIDVLAAIAEQRPRTRIAVRTDGYIHIIERSRLFGYADDIEFLVDTTHQQIHVRSASRVGRGDMGVNRQRYEAYRAAFIGRNQ
jgi:uncharacterized protein (DUF1499 family)